MGLYPARTPQSQFNICSVRISVQDTKIMPSSVQMDQATKKDLPKGKEHGQKLCYKIFAIS